MAGTFDNTFDSTFDSGPAAALVSITVTPFPIGANAGAAVQATATGIYSDASTADLTVTAAWSSSNPAIATVSATGVVTGIAAGTATITATSGAISGTTTVNVTASTVKVTTCDGRIEAQFFLPANVTLTVTNGAGAAKSIPIPAGFYYLTDLIAILVVRLNTYSDSTAWTVTLSTGVGATGQVTISCTGTWTLTFTSPELRQLLGFAADIPSVTTAQKGTAQARSIWLPDCPLMLDNDPRVAPQKSDQRTTQSPTGIVFGLIGNRRYVHTNLKWSHVSPARTWQQLEQLANQSWQTFLLDTQWLMGAGAIASWFRVASPCRIYDTRGVQVGTSLPNGWQMIGVMDCKPVQPMGQFTGWNTIAIPQIVASL